MTRYRLVAHDAAPGRPARVVLFLAPGGVPWDNDDPVAFRAMAADLLEAASWLELGDGVGRPGSDQPPLFGEETGR